MGEKTRNCFDAKRIIENCYRTVFKTINKFQPIQDEEI